MLSSGRMLSPGVSARVLTGTWTAWVLLSVVTCRILGEERGGGGHNRQTSFHGYFGQPIGRFLKWWEYSWRHFKSCIREGRRCATANCRQVIVYKNRSIQDRIIPPRRNRPYFIPIGGAAGHAASGWRWFHPSLEWQPVQHSWPQDR